MLQGRAGEQFKAYHAEKRELKKKDRKMTLWSWATKKESLISEVAFPKATGNIL